MESLLQVRNLTIGYRGRDAVERRALDDLSFELGSGETLGLLGQSGCGKTTLALALLRLLPRTARVLSGSIHFRGRDILHADERTLQAIRGAEASIVFQEPAMSLNPVMRVGDQIAEVARAHSNANRRTHREDAELALAAVHLAGTRMYTAYPHQLSSGQRQRIAIAQALVCKPAFLIADEPTSALDNTTQKGILDLLKELKQRLQIALLFITHNPALLAGFADRLLIMSEGRFVEEGSPARIRENPKHSYTRELFRSTPPFLAARTPMFRAPGQATPIVKVLHLRKRYVQGRWYSRNRFQVAALDDISLTIPMCSTLALVGESGAGKSTLGRCLCRLEEPDSGEIWFEEKNLLALAPQELFALRRNIQFIFQDSATAMNPRFSLLDIVEEPLRLQSDDSWKIRRQQALAMMERVGISPQWANRSPFELSGGQRQRLAIARALVLRPRLLILDEALSSLDLPIQMQIMDLLLGLQTSLSLTYLFITHDLPLAVYMADQIAVLQEGRMVESGSISTVFSSAKHPYTHLLLAAIPGGQSAGTGPHRQ